MNKINYCQTTFLLSVAECSQLPLDAGAEVAFIGRSNAGKSSALNALTNQKGLARTSKTPGRTQLINFFKIDDQKRLVDLPGYGYAAVGVAIRKQWQRLIDEYLRNRSSLKGLILLTDIRHPMHEFEQDLLMWAREIELPVHVLLTKADKLSKAEMKKVLSAVSMKINELCLGGTVQCFSSTKKIGIDELKQKLNDWL